MRYWFPSLYKPCYSLRPEVGTLIGLDFKAWRVERIEEMHPGDWSDEARATWVAEGSPEPWQLAPFRIIATPAQGGEEHEAHYVLPRRPL